MNLRQKLIILARHCYAMGHEDGARKVDADAKILEGVIDNFIDEEQPNQPEVK